MIPPNTKCTITFEAKKKFENKKAILVTHGNRDYWLARAFTQVNSDGTYTLPEWMAKEKGIV